MKILFEIGEWTKAANSNLLLEIGTNYTAFACLNKDAHTIEALGAYAFVETALADELPGLLNRFSSLPVSSVQVASAFPEALLVPQKFFNGDYGMLEAMYGQPAQQFQHDAIPEWQMVVVYALPSAVHNVLAQSFSSISYMHVYTPMVKLYSGFMADEQLLLHLMPGQFRVLVKGAGNVLLAQTYRYETPHDLVYYLLRICGEFGLNQSTTQIIFSGMVQKPSALYAEVESYFAAVHFANPPELELPQTDVPHHFFTSLYNLALCAS